MLLPLNCRATEEACVSWCRSPNTRKHPKPPCPPRDLTLSLEQCELTSTLNWARRAVGSGDAKRRAWGHGEAGLVVCGLNIFGRGLILSVFVCLFALIWGWGRSNDSNFGYSKGQTGMSARPVGIFSAWVDVLALAGWTKRAGFFLFLFHFFHYFFIHFL